LGVRNSISSATEPVLAKVLLVGDLAERGQERRSAERSRVRDCELVVVGDTLDGGCPAAVMTVARSAVKLSGE